MCLPAIANLAPSQDVIRMIKPAISSLPRTKRFLAMLWPVLAVLCCIVVWAVAIARADNEARRAETLVLKEADTYAQAYEQYVTRSIAQMDQITMQLTHNWEHSHRSLLLENMRADGMFTDHAFVTSTCCTPPRTKARGSTAFSSAVFPARSPGAPPY